MRMKKLMKIKLNQLSKANLESRESNALKGGADCLVCVCVCMGSNFPEASYSIESHTNHATGYVPKGNV